MLCDRLPCAWPGVLQLHRIRWQQLMVCKVQRAQMMVPLPHWSVTANMPGNLSAARDDGVHAMYKCCVLHRQILHASCSGQLPMHRGMPFAGRTNIGGMLQISYMPQAQLSKATQHPHMKSYICGLHLHIKTVHGTPIRVLCTSSSTCYVVGWQCEDCNCIARILTYVTYYCLHQISQYNELNPINQCTSA